MKWFSASYLFSMTNFLDYLGSLALAHPEWTQLIIGIGIIIQGEVTTLLSLYLVVGKQITLFEFLISALTGLFIGETCIYLFGRKLRGTRFGWGLYRRMKGNRKIQLYTYYLKRHTIRILMVAKFLPGMNTLMILLMGWTKTEFKKFMRVYIPVALFWLTVVTFSAYAVTSGLHYLKENKIFEDIEYLVLGLIVAFFIGEYLVKKAIQWWAPKDLPALEDEEK